MKITGKPKSRKHGKRPRAARAPGAKKRKRQPGNWGMAENMYAGMHARTLVPFLHGPPTQEELVSDLEEMIARCPQFYPAVLELAFKKLKAGDEVAGRRGIEQGFDLMVQFSEDLEDEAERLVDNLGSMWRFDLSRSCLEQLVESHLQTALYHDELAAAAARTGDLDTALAVGARALQIEPGNAFYRSNLGWYYLMVGNLDEAADNLNQSLKLDETNAVTQGNLRVLQYLRQHGGTYVDYLLRPADHENLNKLADREEWQDADELCSDYNACRREAMAQTMLLRGETARLPDILATLDAFFGFVDGLSQEPYFLYEDIMFVGGHFKLIMHKFIVKFGDLDREMIEGIYESLFLFYRFLTEKDLISPAALKSFVSDTQALKGDLIEKMERYNAIRHDQDLDEGEKEEIRAELFEGDHLWPFI